MDPLSHHSFVVSVIVFVLALSWPNRIYIRPIILQALLLPPDRLPSQLLTINPLFGIKHPPSFHGALQVHYGFRTSASSSAVLLRHTY